MLDALRQLTAKGGEMKIFGLSTAVRSLFERIRLQKLVDIYNTPKWRAPRSGTSAAIPSNHSEQSMQLLAIVPGIWAIIVAFSKSPEAAFVNVYIPVLLCLPDYYRWVAPGLPDPSFSHAAILPVTLAFLLKNGLKWKFSLGDLLVLGYASCVGYSEFSNAGYAEAQNLMFDMVCLVLLPYALTKALVEPKGMRVEFAKKLVMCLFLISVISVYEFKFASTPWRMVLDRFFPGQGAGWVTTFRWGFARIAGPFGHAILAGTILTIGFRIQRWLEWSGHWEPQFRKFTLPIPKSRAITLGIAAGIFMTMVRGPWIGGVLAAGIAMIGRAKNRARAAAAVASAMVVSKIYTRSLIEWSPVEPFSGPTHDLANL
jgi:hypothetical protein